MTLKGCLWYCRFEI